MSVRTIEVLTNKILKLQCYIRADQIGNNIVSSLLDNAKTEYIGKLFKKEGLIININNIIKYSDVKISNVETSDFCETTIEALCCVCYVPVNTTIVCKVLLITPISFQGVLLNEKVFIPLINPGTLFNKSIKKDSFIIIKVSKNGMYKDKIVLIGNYVDMANDAEIKQYFDEENKTKNI